MIEKIYIFLKEKLFLGSIRFYQKYISSGSPRTCRFYPTCSAYTYKAIERFGIFRGTIMGMCRILRCNPFCKSGYDPVPEKFSLKPFAGVIKKDE